MACKKCKELEAEISRLRREMLRLRNRHKPRKGVRSEPSMKRYR